MQREVLEASSDLANRVDVYKRQAQAVANLDIDLIGCKSCVKITATNGTIGALALGDATNCPVKESI